jgi:hypothetical protein
MSKPDSEFRQYHFSLDGVTRRRLRALQECFAAGGTPAPMSSIVRAGIAFLAEARGVRIPEQAPKPAAD